MMKKLLLTATITALSTLALNANTITLNATVPVSAHVTLGTTPASLTSTTAFTAFDATSVALTLGTTEQVLLNQPVNLVTNQTPANVTMTLSNIDLKLNGTSTSIGFVPTCSYAIEGGSFGTVTNDTAFTLTNVPDVSTSTPVGTLKCVTDISSTQTAGTYQGTINVAITAG
jgi:hypothetical protein